MTLRVVGVYDPAGPLATGDPYWAGRAATRRGRSGWATRCSWPRRRWRSSRPPR
ncbi:hypothetical protein ACFQZ4_31365 [Catellatospora coxensis]